MDSTVDFIEGMEIYDSQLVSADDLIRLLVRMNEDLLSVAVESNFAFSCTVDMLESLQRRGAKNVVDDGYEDAVIKYNLYNDGMSGIQGEVYNYLDDTDNDVSHYTNIGHIYLDENARDYESFKQPYLLDETQGTVGTGFGATDVKVAEPVTYGPHFASTTMPRPGAKPPRAKIIFQEFIDDGLIPGSGMTAEEAMILLESEEDNHLKMKIDYYYPTGEIVNTNPDIGEEQERINLQNERGGEFDPDRLLFIYYSTQPFVPVARTEENTENKETKINILSKLKAVARFVKPTNPIEDGEGTQYPENPTPTEAPNVIHDKLNTNFKKEVDAIIALSHETREIDPQILHLMCIVDDARKYFNKTSSPKRGFLKEDILRREINTYEKSIIYANNHIGHFLKAGLGFTWACSLKTNITDVRWRDTNNIWKKICEFVDKPYIPLIIKGSPNRFNESITINSLKQIMHKLLSITYSYFA